jgi:hypothetical protein
MLSECTTCGASFVTDRRKVKACSRSCALAYSWKTKRHAAMADTLAARFDALIDKSGDCWLWTGTVMTTGYGRLGRTGFAHRLAWELANGTQLRPGEQINHICDNRRCVRPSHLYRGSQRDNMQDRLQRGKYARGTDHHMVKAKLRRLAHSA